MCFSAQTTMNRIIILLWCNVLVLLEAQYEYYKYLSSWPPTLHEPCEPWHQENQDKKTLPRTGVNTSYYYNLERAIKRTRVVDSENSDSDFEDSDYEYEDDDMTVFSTVLQKQIAEYKYMKTFVQRYYKHYMKRYEKQCSLERYQLDVKGKKQIFYKEPALDFERTIIENLAEISDCFYVVEYNYEIYREYYMDEIKYYSFGEEGLDAKTIKDIRERTAEPYVEKMEEHLKRFNDFKKYHGVKSERDFLTFTRMLERHSEASPGFDEAHPTPHEYRPLQFEYVLAYKFYIFYYKRSRYIEYCTTKEESDEESLQKLDNMCPRTIVTDGNDTANYIRMVKYRKYMEDKYKKGFIEKRLRLWEMQNNYTSTYGEFPDPFFIFFPIRPSPYKKTANIESFVVHGFQKYLKLLDKYTLRIKMSRNPYVNPKERLWFISKYKEYKRLIRDYQHMFKGHLPRQTHRHTYKHYMALLDHYENVLMDKYEEVLDLWEKTTTTAAGFVGMLNNYIAFHLHYSWKASTVERRPPPTIWEALQHLKPLSHHL